MGKWQLGCGRAHVGTQRDAGRGGGQIAQQQWCLHGWCHLSAGARAVGLARWRGLGMPCGSHLTLSPLRSAAQRREMSFATMETGGSVSLLSWRQVRLLWRVAQGGAALVGTPVLSGTGSLLISLLGLFFGRSCTLWP